MSPLSTMLRALVLLVVLAGGAAAEGLSTVPLHSEPQPLPEVSFTDAAGEPVTLQNWRGKVVLLNIWATWCAPCREEMPTLDRLQRRLGGDRFEVVALSVDRAGVDVVRKFFDEIGIKHLAIFIDQDMSLLRELAIYGLPATLLIDPDGHEIGRLAGPAEWDAPEMISSFQDILNEYRKDDEKP
ncbi:TlpA family protein disulfide reductase [Nitratireductor luteus]|uniref:TlpA family protein disulfide reductase n=1 Tax=Nitratireductor luteus TaxID=2976980 RepID=UPI00223F4DAB|nr:TlpA disulfide reductase family protein [Nitratireductor luteus]